MKKFEDLQFTEIRTKEENQKVYGKWATDTIETENQEHAIMFFNLQNEYHNTYNISGKVQWNESGYYEVMTNDEYEYLSSFDEPCGIEIISNIHTETDKGK